MEGIGHKRRKWRSSRCRIAPLASADRRKQILVLDNVSKLSIQNLDLFRYPTWGKRFQFVSIVESFLSSNDLFLRRVRMDPWILIIIPKSR